MRVSISHNSEREKESERESKHRDSENKRIRAERDRERSQKHLKRMREKDFISHVMMNLCAGERERGERVIMISIKVEQDTC